jgi:hypothetical protein
MIPFKAHECSAFEEINYEDMDSRLRGQAARFIREEEVDILKKKIV